VLAAALGVYMLYLLALVGFLAICGVPRAEIAKWGAGVSWQLCKPLMDQDRPL
jgi:hypothetical protein